MKLRAGGTLNAIRTLPFVVPPADAHPGGAGAESFAGYVDRLAAYLEIPLDALLRRTGVMADGDRTVSGGYGIFLTTERLNRFCYSTGLPEAMIEATLLASYGGVCGDFSAVVANPSVAARSPYERPWAYLTGSHACPACLDESDGVWNLSWKLPWSFACVRHNALMRDVCPGCEGRYRTGWQPNRGKPVQISRIPEPASCMNTGVNGGGRCGYPLAAADTHSLIDYPGVLQAQERLNQLLSENVSPVQVAGEITSPLRYFETLRVLSALLFTYGTADDLGDAPPFVLEAFEQAKQQSVQRKGPLARIFGMPPESAAALSAVVPASVEMLDSRSSAELSKRLEPLVRRAITKGMEASAGLRLLITAAPGFVEAFERARSKRSSVAELLLTNSTTAGTRPARYRRLSPDNVPQLFWEETYDELFAGFFASNIRRFARRVCSMSVVRLLDYHSWTEIERVLELPTYSRKQAARIVHTLQNEARLDDFAQSIEEIVRRLDATPDNERINYKQRREALTHLDVVPYDEWTQICEIAGIGAGKDGVLNRCAAIWIWCRIAGGDPWFSPAIRNNDNNTIRVHYHRFGRRCTGELARLLTDYGLALLREAGCR